MGVPPASPVRFKLQPVDVGAPPPPPPPPTFRGRFEEIAAETPDAEDRKRALWEHSMAVVTFLRSDLEPRLRQRLGATVDTDPMLRGALTALEKAETALMFNLSGIQGYDPSRDYEGPPARAFDYVRSGASDAFVDRVLAAFRTGPIPMPDPRADAQDYEDWVAFHPLYTAGRRRHRKTHRRQRRGKRTYRHSVRKRQG